MKTIHDHNHFPEPYACVMDEPPDSEEIIDMLRSERDYLRAQRDIFRALCREALAALQWAACHTSGNSLQFNILIGKLASVGCTTGQASQASQGKETL